MKTAISVPDEVFREAERLARRSGRSRSELYSRAMREYLARHAPDRVTAAMNDAVKAVGTSKDALAAAAAQRTLRRSEW